MGLDDDGHRLKADSPYKGNATDSTDVGCDFDTLMYVTAGVVKQSSGK